MCRLACLGCGSGLSQCKCGRRVLMGSVVVFQRPGLNLSGGSANIDGRSLRLQLRLCRERLCGCSLCSCHHPCRASPCSPSRLETPHSEGPICWRLGDLCQMSRRSVTLQSPGEAKSLWENPGGSWPGGGLGRVPAGERSPGASETGGSLAGSCPPQTRGVKKTGKKKGLSCFLGSSTAAEPHGPNSASDPLCR